MASAGNHRYAKALVFEESSDYNSGESNTLVCQNGLLYFNGNQLSSATGNQFDIFTANKVTRLSGANIQWASNLVVLPPAEPININPTASAGQGFQSDGEFLYYNGIQISAFSNIYQDAQPLTSDSITPLGNTAFVVHSNLIVDNVLFANTLATTIASKTLHFSNNGPQITFNSTDFNIQPVSVGTNVQFLGASSGTGSDCNVNFVSSNTNNLIGTDVVNLKFKNQGHAGSADTHHTVASLKAIQSTPFTGEEGGGSLTLTCRNPQDGTLTADVQNVMLHMNTQSSVANTIVIAPDTIARVGIMAGYTPAYRFQVGSNLYVDDGTNRTIGLGDRYKIVTPSNVWISGATGANDRVTIGPANQTGTASIAIGHGAMSSSKSVGVGWELGTVTEGSVHIGYNAQSDGTFQNVVAIGRNTKASLEGVAIGSNSGTLAAQYSVSIGKEAGSVLQSGNAVAIGRLTGQFSQESNAVAIGCRAGNSEQKREAVSIGSGAGESTQGSFSVAIGVNSGKVNQKTRCVAIGPGAGENAQNAYSVAIGNNSGFAGQYANAVAIGNYSGFTGQNTASVAIGDFAGFQGQYANSVAIGYQAAKYNQKNISIAIGDFAGYKSQGALSVAIGHRCGNDSQGTSALAIGVGAGESSQGAATIGIGSFAGFSKQQYAAISIGALAGGSSQNAYSIALGYAAGQLYQAGNTVAIGELAGYSLQAAKAISIGYYAGKLSQNEQGIAIGSFAGQTSQGNYATAIGQSAAFEKQGYNGIAIGLGAARYSQNVNSTSIGSYAGDSYQGGDAIAIGTFAGGSSQNSFAVSIGTNAGQFYQGAEAVAIGYGAGKTTQGNDSVAIGKLTGYVDQDAFSVAIGFAAGQNSQGTSSVAIGNQTAVSKQDDNAIAIGQFAGYLSQNTFCIAMGHQAGNSYQDDYAVAIGVNAGRSQQSTYSVAVGANAGFNELGEYSVAVGANAGFSGEGNFCTMLGNLAGYNGGNYDNVICINGTNGVLNPAGADRCYINPVRNDSSNTSTYCLKWSTTTKEVTYDTAKTFVIDHPDDKEKYLVHGCLEGPEGGVYYRGRGEVGTSVVLPKYVPNLIKGEPTIQITPIYNGSVRTLNCSEYDKETNSFEVFGTEGPFYWTFTAKRCDVNVEPLKADTNVSGDGPYLFTD